MEPHATTANLSVELRVPASSSDSTAAPGGPSDHRGDRGMLPSTGAHTSLVLALVILLALVAATIRRVVRRAAAFREI